MKKFTFLLACLLVAGASVYAGFPYTLSTFNQPYQHLNGATSINGTTIWDDDDYMIPMPFNFSYGGRVTGTFNVSLGQGGFASGLTDTVSAFIYGEMDLVDKGALTNAATISPLQYLVTGTAPNRIFKFEIANAGFYDEIDQNNTTSDSVNIQVWLYETTNVVELRYGPSATNPNYFLLGNGPLVGYLADVDMNVGPDKIYSLSGNPAAPTLDSIDFNTGSGSVLNSYPANGTVHRFTPKTATGVSTVPAFANMQVYPTLASTLLNVDFNEHQSANYEVVGLDGRLAGVSGKLSQGSNKLDVGNLAAGMYLLRVANGSNRSIFRFTKK